MSAYGQYHDEYYHPQFGYVQRRQRHNANGGIGNGNGMRPSNASVGAMSIGDPGSGSSDVRSHLGRADDVDREMMLETNVDDDDVDDEYAPIPIQYASPGTNMMRKGDGKSVPKF